MDDWIGLFCMNCWTAVLEWMTGLVCFAGIAGLEC